MNWFNKVQKHGVCKECGVHFEPVTGYQSRWGDLCSMHRKPVIERDEKKARVMAWAEINWERFTEQMEKEKAEEVAAYYDRLSKGALSASHLRQGQCADQIGRYGQNIFGLGGQIGA